MHPSVKFAGGRRVTRWTCETIIEKIAEWQALQGEAPCSADWNPSLARWRAQEWRVERYYAGQWPSTNAVNPISVACTQAVAYCRYGAGEVGST